MRVRTRSHRIHAGFVAVVVWLAFFGIATPATAVLRVSPSGSDSAPCTQAQPCQSFARAYQVAAPGDLVEVLGTFGAQSIPPGPAKASTDKVVFAPAPGSSASVDGRLDVRASHLEFRDIDVSGLSAGPGARHVTFRGVSTRGFSEIASASWVSIIGGDFGPVSGGADALQIKPNNLGEPTPDQILIDGVRFHDVVLAGQSHTDCIQVGGATNLTIRNSTFERCAHSDIIMGTFNGGVFGTTLIENNFFGPTTHSYYAVHAEAAAVDLTFRYNSIGDQGVILGTANGGGARNVRVVGNVGTLGTACKPTATYSRNVWKDARCSSSDVRAGSGFVNASKLDYRLSPGSAAIRAGDAADHPATDIFGRPRGIGGPPDAGAHEFSSPAGPLGAAAQPGGAVGGAPGSTAEGGGAQPPAQAAGDARPRCMGRVATIVGTRGDDRLVGTNKADVIVAFSGDDVVRAGAGDDVVCLGSGDDKAVGGPGRDRIRGGVGKDRIQGGRARDVIWGAQHRDLIWGGPGPDLVRGGRGPDFMSGGPGRDRLWGGAGRDRALGGRGPDVVLGGAGLDRGSGGPGRDRLRSIEIGRA